mgnify:CR=1 FL=1
MALSMDKIYQEILRDGGETPSKKVRETAERFPDMIAMRYKEYGIWQETSYKDFWLKSNYLGMASRHFGVSKGDIWYCGGEWGGRALGGRRVDL